MVNQALLRRRRRGVTWCAQATLPRQTPENQNKLCSEEEGLHGVHKRLRRDKHPKNKRGPLEVQRKTGCHPKEANPKKASVRELCSEEEGLQGVHKRLRRDKHPKIQTAKDLPQAVTQVRPNPRKWPLCVSFGIWPCMHSRLPHSTQYAPRNLRRELEKTSAASSVSDGKQCQKCIGPPCTFSTGSRLSPQATVFCSGGMQSGKLWNAKKSCCAVLEHGSWCTGSSGCLRG
jgi:hypothetical protein